MACRSSLYRYLVPAVLLLPVLGPGMPTARADQVDDLVHAQMKKHHIPGLSLAVLKEGRVIKARGYGLANVELNVAATPRTVYVIGSLTKQFTATAIMMLMAEGKIGLEDKITQFVEGLPASYASITIRNLLTHTAGLKDYGVLLYLRRDFSDLGVVKSLASLPLDFAPGEKFAYSNTGYVLLGMVIEKVSGKSYWQFLAERIFKPLNMNQTRRSGAALSDGATDLVPNRAAGYSWIGGTLKNSPRLLWDKADGGMMSTVLDLAKWDAALYTETLLKSSLLEQMWSPATLISGLPVSAPFGSYGYGWEIDTDRGHQLVEHSGRVAGFTSAIARYSTDRLTVVVLQNCDQQGSAPPLAHAVARRYLPALDWRRLHPTADADPAATKTVQQFLSDVANDLAESTVMTSTMKAAIIPFNRAQARSVLNELPALAYLTGEDVGQQGMERRGTRVAHIRYYKLVNGADRHYLTFYLTDAGQVADYQWETE